MRQPLLPAQPSPLERSSPGTAPRLGSGPGPDTDAGLTSGTRAASAEKRGGTGAPGSGSCLMAGKCPGCCKFPAVLSRARGSSAAALLPLEQGESSREMLCGAVRGEREGVRV